MITLMVWVHDPPVTHRKGFPLGFQAELRSSAGLKTSSQIINLTFYRVTPSAPSHARPAGVGQVSRPRARQVCSQGIRRDTKGVSLRRVSLLRTTTIRTSAFILLLLRQWDKMIACSKFWWQKLKNYFKYPTSDKILNFYSEFVWVGHKPLEWRLIFIISFNNQKSFFTIKLSEEHL